MHPKILILSTYYVNYNYLQIHLKIVKWILILQIEWKYESIKNYARLLKRTLIN